MIDKEQRNRLERVAEAMEDPEEVLQCYARIQRLLERLVVSTIRPEVSLILRTIQRNANMDSWRIVDEQATVRDECSGDRFTHEAGCLGRPTACGLFPTLRRRGTSRQSRPTYEGRDARKTRG